MPSKPAKLTMTLDQEEVQGLCLNLTVIFVFLSDSEWRVNELYIKRKPAVKILIRQEVLSKKNYGIHILLKAIIYIYALKLFTLAIDGKHGNRMHLMIFFPDILRKKNIILIV